MILIKHNFLPDPIFSELQKYCGEEEFLIVSVGGKEFSTLPVPETILPYIQVQDFELTLTFVRSAYQGFDFDLRVHADSTINGKPTNLALVLYINNPEGVTKNGTAFWDHEIYGNKLPKVSDAEFDRLLTEEANDLMKWNKTDFVTSQPNKALFYDASLFHSKWPKEIKKGVRKVLVAFYTKKQL